MKNDSSTPLDAGRRRFLHQLSGAGLALGGAPWLVSCGGSGGDAQDLPATESRTYYFNLPGGPAATDYFLVAGTVNHKLVNATPAHLAAIRADIPNLPVNGLTHVAEQIQMSGQSPQVCYVKGVHSADPADWTMYNMMYHVPAGGTAAAAVVRSACKSEGDLLRQAFTSCPTASASDLQALIAGATFCSDPQYDAYKDFFDHAVALVSNHPEIGSFDPATLAYVQQNIICADPAVFDLAVHLVRHPKATVAGGDDAWAKLVPFIDPATQKVRIDAHGQQVCSTLYTTQTLNLMGVAMQSVLTKIKDDPNLGVNITDLKADQRNTARKGKRGVVRNGTPTAPGAGTGTSSLFTSTPSANATSTFTARDVSAAPGMSITNFAATGRTVNFTVSNWYLRYLGLYARFLDSNDAPIKLSSLSVSDQFPFSGLNGTYDGFISIVNQELVILGIPIQQNTQNFSIKVPDAAASVRILAGGLGIGVKEYPDTIDAGAIMTEVLDLALPGLFLAMAAVSGYATLTKRLSTKGQLLVSTAQIFIAGVTDLGLYAKYHDTAEFANMIAPVAGLLLKGAKELFTLVTEALAEGEAIGAAEDCAPFGIGLVLQAVMALATAAQIIETGAEVAQSPWTYDTVAAFSHDLAVTINHDPADVAGFPATATKYRLIAVCDGSSPRDSGLIDMPAGTRTAPLVYTFKGLPAGGKVNVSVSFKSASDTLVGAGSTGELSNLSNTASITIKEVLVPLTASTRYSHKQKTALDAAGKHVWAPTTAAPPAPALNCGNPEGNLCELVGITLSEPFGAVGYGWKASSTGVTSFTGQTGQLYQFANIAFTENPQSGYMSSGVGFPLPARIAYDRASPTSNSFYIDSTSGKSLVRRINMTGVGVPPTFDGPASNRCVGQFNFASDAFLIHPTGKLISFNSALSKMEVLTPSATPTTDANAVKALSLSGPGSREGLLKGPVCAAVAPKGAILVIEAGNNRIQAFDTGANPSKEFGASTTMPLVARDGVTYLDLSVEFTGFIYVLLLDANGVFVLDIYRADGTFLSSTTDVRASKFAIDLFRNTYTLNFENIGKAGVVEPSVSLWIPST
jgi:hypothetical protein